MIACYEMFRNNLSMFMSQIEMERPEPKKSKAFGIMLKGLFDSVIVHSLFVRKNNTPEIMLRLRQLLVLQLRDADFNVRYIATEGFARMLMCESTDKFTDYIARLILLLFQKQPNILDQQAETLKGHIKNTIEEFLQHYVRLSKQRSDEVFIATVMVLAFLLKNNCEPGFQQIN